MKLFSFLTVFAVTGAISAAEMPNLLKNGSFEEGLDKTGAPKHWIIDRSDKVDGVVKLELPADDSVYVTLKIKNIGSEACQFTVRIQDAIGTLDNPVILDSIAAFAADLTAGGYRRYLSAVDRR